MRVSVKTRDLVNKLIAEELPGKTVDEAIQFLYTQHWQMRCVEDWDRLRERPEDYQEYRNEIAAVDDQLPMDIAPFEDVR